MVFALLIPLGPATAQQDQADMGAMLKDLMQIRYESEVIVFGMWLPLEFWEAAFAASGNVSPAARKEVMDVLRPYMMFFLAKADVGPLGGQTFLPEAELRRKIRLIDTKGNEYAPLEESEISADVNNLLASMRPVIAKSAGKMGKGMFPLVFTATSRANTEIAQATTKGRLTISVAEKTVSWRTPLGSLVPPKKDPTTGEIMNGAWTYSPWTGRRLVPAK